MSRRGAWWAEEALYWVGHDGVYTARGRTGWSELTQPVRRLFRTGFLPDSTAVATYQDRCLYLIRGTAAWRYHFPTETWTRHTLTGTMSHSAAWRDPTGTYQQMWLLDSAGNVVRWQPGTSPADANRATSDAGSAIGGWTYSTGYALRQVYVYGAGYGARKCRVRALYADVDTGTVTATEYKEATGTPSRQKVFTAGEHQLQWASDESGYKFRLGLAAANATSLRRLMWEREMIDGEGA